MVIAFKAGDLVTRDGTDIHVVISTDGETMEVECVKEPLGYLEEDGFTRGTPWTRKGERETNLCRRYEFAGEVIEGQLLDSAPRHAAAGADEACGTGRL